MQGSSGRRRGPGALVRRSRPRCRTPRRPSATGRSGNGRNRRPSAARRRASGTCLAHGGRLKEPRELGLLSRSLTTACAGAGRRRPFQFSAGLGFFFSQFGEARVEVRGAGEDLKKRPRAVNVVTPSPIAGKSP